MRAAEVKPVRIKESQKTDPEKSCFGVEPPAGSEDIPLILELIGRAFRNREDEETKAALKKRHRDGASSYAFFMVIRKPPMEDALTMCRFLADELGFLPNACTLKGDSLLHLAARRDSPELFLFLIEKQCSIHTKDAAKKTPLFFTVMHSMEMTRMLLERSAEINAKDHNGQSPIFYAARYDLASMQILLESGAEFNKRDTCHQQTPIYYAACYNSLLAVQLLVKFKAAVNVVDRQHQTPLFYSKLESISFLLAAHCQVDHKDRWGRTALHFVSHPGAARLLLDGDADVNASSAKGRTAIFYKEGVDVSIPLMQFLISRRANVNHADECQRVPLHFPCDPLYTRCLIEARADVECLDKYGQTPLFFAAAHKDHKVAVQTIVQLVSSCTSSRAQYISIVDRFDRTALSHAQEKGTDEAVTMLLKMGAKPAEESRARRSHASREKRRVLLQAEQAHSSLRVTAVLVCYDKNGREMPPEDMQRMRERAFKLHLERKRKACATSSSTQNLREMQPDSLGSHPRSDGHEREAQEKRVDPHEGSADNWFAKDPEKKNVDMQEGVADQFTPDLV